jgi:RNA recognition motif. (a.k.a. RRM, RBD, or RNP domain)
MSNDYSPRSGGGNKRGRRRSGGSSDRRRNSDTKYDRPRREESKKELTLVEKITAFFKKAFGGSNGKTKRPNITTTSSTSPRTKSVMTETRPAQTRTPKAEHKTELEAPNPDMVTSPRLYVGNLSYDTAESDLFDLFSKVGSVRNVELVMDRRANRSKGFGFVEMNDIEVAKEAVMKLHRQDFQGRQIVVSGAKSDRRETESAPAAPEQPEV